MSGSALDPGNRAINKPEKYPQRFHILVETDNTTTEVKLYNSNLHNNLQ